MKISSSTRGLALLFAFATSVSAHATFQEFWAGSTDKVGSCVRLPVSNNPITSVSTSDIACNVGASASPGTCSVAAGSQISVEMHQQPGDRTCTTEAIGGNHDGPTILYMAKVDNAATAVGSSASWFKIAATGLVSKDYWGTDVMNANCGKVTATIPADIKPGDYLLRAEVIALHVAGSVGGAQFYVSCYQLTVTGGGSASPSTVKFPGAYSATDPGILFDLYGTYTTYTIPGPAIYGGGGSTTPVTTTGAGGSTTTTVSKTTTTTSAASTSTAGTAAHYGQCGGIGWTGPTVCVSPYVCTKNGDYYSQCI